MWGIFVVMHKMKKVSETKKPLFSIISIACAVSSLPMGRLGAELFGTKEDYTGYGALGMAITIFVVCLVIGMFFGLAGLLRSEKPLILAISTTAINASAIIWLLVNKPG